MSDDNLLARSPAVSTSLFYDPKDRVVCATTPRIGGDQLILDAGRTHLRGRRKKSEAAGSALELLDHPPDDAQVSVTNCMQIRGSHVRYSIRTAVAVRSSDDFESPTSIESGGVGGRLGSKACDFLLGSAVGAHHANGEFDDLFSGIIAHDAASGLRILRGSGEMAVQRRLQHAKYQGYKEVGFGFLPKSMQIHIRERVDPMGLRWLYMNRVTAISRHNEYRYRYERDNALVMASGTRELPVLLSKGAFFLAGSAARRVLEVLLAS